MRALVPQDLVSASAMHACRLSVGKVIERRLTALAIGPKDLLEQSVVGVVGVDSAIFSGEEFPSKLLKLLRLGFEAGSKLLVFGNQLSLLFSKERVLILVESQLLLCVAEVDRDCAIFLLKLLGCDFLRFQLVNESLVLSGFLLGGEL